MLVSLKPPHSAELPERSEFVFFLPDRFAADLVHKTSQQIWTRLESIPTFFSCDVCQESGVSDYMGMFAVACMGCDKMVKEFEELNDDYSKIMVQVTSTR